MAETGAGPESRECPECEERIDPLRDEFGDCPACGKPVRFVPRRRGPALLALALAAGLWAAAVLPAIGRDGSAELAFVATALVLSLLAWLQRRWSREGTQSVKVLKAGKRVFWVMLVVAAPFTLLSLYLRLAGDATAANWTIGQLLEMQARLAEWQALTRLRSVSVWLLLGAALTGVGLILLNRPWGLARLLRYRKTTSKLLTLVTLIVISFGSFSIIVASGAAPPLRMADEQIAGALRRTAESLQRLEAQARIVVGEQLAAAIVEAPAPVSGQEMVSETDAALNELRRAEDELAAITEGRLSAEDPPPSGDPAPSRELGQILAAYQRAFSRSPRPPPPPPRLADYARYTVAQVDRAANLPNMDRQRPSARRWTRATVREAVHLFVDLAMDGAGIRIPSVDVPRPWGAFFGEVVETVVSKPANDALKRAATDVTIGFLDGEISPDARVEGVARRTAPRLGALKDSLQGRLQRARQAIGDWRTAREAALAAEQAEATGGAICTCQLVRIPGNIPIGPPFQKPCPC